MYIYIHTYINIYMCIYIYIGESGSPVNYYYIHALCNIKHRLCHENEITHLSVGGIVVGF